MSLGYRKPLPLYAGFNHNKPHLFVETQCGRLGWYVVYRWIVAAYFLSVLLYNALVYQHGAKWLILFTNWNFFLLNMQCCLLAVFSTIHWHSPYAPNTGAFAKGRLPFYFKLLWLLYNVTTSGALVVSGMYWGVVYEGWKLTIINVTTHALNSAYVLLDMCVTAIPVRPLHVYQPVMFGACYAVFSILYWFAGGTNEKGFPYTYKVLDWGNRPIRALVYASVLTLIIAPVCHFIVFGLHRLRIWVYKQCACALAKHRTLASNGRKDSKLTKKELFKSYALNGVFAKNASVKKS